MTRFQFYRCMAVFSALEALDWEGAISFGSAKSSVDCYLLGDGVIGSIHICEVEHKTRVSLGFSKFINRLITDPVHPADT